MRYRDLDTLGHVNNAVYGTYLEGGRMRYFDRVLEVPFEGLEMVLAPLDVDFRRPVTMDEGPVRVACGVTDLGESSIEMACEVYAGEDAAPAATAESVQVARAGEALDGHRFGEVVLPGLGERVAGRDDDEVLREFPDAVDPPVDPLLGGEHEAHHEQGVAVARGQEVLAAGVDRLADARAEQEARSTRRRGRRGPPPGLAWRHCAAPG